MEESRERPRIRIKEREEMHRWFNPEIPVYFGPDQDAPHWKLVEGRFRAQADKEEVEKGRLSDVSAWKVNEVEEVVLWREGKEIGLREGEEVYLFNSDARKKRRKAPKGPNF